jgi:hypothetical protein
MHTRFLLIVLLVIAADSFAQCPVADAGPNRTICQGATTILGPIIAPTGVTYAWSPGQSLSSTSVPNPIASPTTATTYTLTMTPPNLIQNGDFEAGQTGFSTDYGIWPAGDGLCGQEHFGSATVSTDPSLLKDNWCSYTDHTPVGNNMLVVDATCVQDHRIWYQTVNVQPNTTYTFSGWASMNGHDLGDPMYQPRLRVRINNTVNIIQDFHVPYSSCVGWVNFTATWASGSNTTATIAIYEIISQQAVTISTLMIFSSDVLPLPTM